MPKSSSLKNNSYYGLMYINDETKLQDTIEDVLSKLLLEFFLKHIKEGGRLERKGFNTFVAHKFKIKKQLVSRFLLELKKRGIVEISNTTHSGLIIVKNDKLEKRVRRQ